MNCEELAAVGTGIKRREEFSLSQAGAQPLTAPLCPLSGPSACDVSAGPCAGSSGVPGSAPWPAGLFGVHAAWIRGQLGRAGAPAIVVRGEC